MPYIQIFCVIRIDGYLAGFAALGRLYNSPLHYHLTTMDSYERTLNQRILGAESTYPVTFGQLGVGYDDHRDAEALDELVVSLIELRRKAPDAYYVLVHVAATVPTGSHQTIGYIAIDDVPSTQSAPPTDCLHTLLQSISRSKPSRMPRAQVIDARPLPLDDPCLRRYAFSEPCPLACVIAAGLSLGQHIPSPGHGKPSSSWCAALMYWLLVDEELSEKEPSMAGTRAVEPISSSQVAIDRRRCGKDHDFKHRKLSTGWRTEVEKLEKEVAREGRRMERAKA
ncbi:hypothetical protein L226DRAFT_253647 [Lentinus tigrinus ALCF2SS1-7]|uniref:Uncharacterized protein n=1 Tax=Lentinus tigrinus ALCF2SS1-6 TaxID=1328759 RepID=A0A5C2RZU5_9APHY|nr:hypothetical protein L227DRAFT_253461 [Lentinus tigrinus ALCF2SS1-6]RPD79582.1 hypothetical protein L226DRAFT_253647 [Lentinus tigrinus ALCF2SS1-7]